jgi:predicted Ser/Thr protein kinase
MRIFKLVKMSAKKINKNAVELLKEVVQQRMWHQNKIELRLAAMTKVNVMAGKLSYEKASAILRLLGYEKLKEETWNKTKCG